MSSIGKRTKEWLKIRKDWVKLHPPDHQGFYVCGICSLPVKANEMELHHVWGRQGKLLSNVEHLVPTHVICNQEVGSKRGVRVVTSNEYELRKQMDL